MSFSKVFEFPLVRVKKYLVIPLASISFSPLFFISFSIIYFFIYSSCFPSCFLSNCCCSACLYSDSCF